MGWEHQIAKEFKKRDNPQNYAYLPVTCCPRCHPAAGRAHRHRQDLLPAGGQLRLPAQRLKGPGRHLQGHPPYLPHCHRAHPKAEDHPSGSVNPRLHTDEILIALSICAATNPTARAGHGPAEKAAGLRGPLHRHPLPCGRGHLPPAGGQLDLRAPVPEQKAVS